MSLSSKNSETPTPLSQPSMVHFEKIFNMFLCYFNIALLKELYGYHLKRKNVCANEQKDCFFLGTKFTNKFH